ncbi:MAG: FtsX-like permease family protein [Breznakibacter sp.]
MNTIGISIKNLTSKPLNLLLNVGLMATGIAIIAFLWMIKARFTEQSDKNTLGVNLVVGAKGSPLQLILSSLYHIDYPTGNIRLSEAEQIAHNPLVKKAVPLALGDNFRGFRIVGTTHDYAALFNAKIARGQLWENDLEVTIGANVARQEGLSIGDSFVGMHGFAAEADQAHDEFKYRVVGIFEETSTVLDQLILTRIQNVWEIHAHHHHGDETEAGHDESDGHAHHDRDCDHHHEEPATIADSTREITALLVFYRNPMGAVSLPRHINKNTNMQAASPVAEINRLYDLLGAGIKSVNLIALTIVLMAGFSIFVSLLGSMKERTYELAVMRVVGGRKRTLFSIVVFEGIIISIAAFVVAYILSRIGLWAVSSYAENNFRVGLDEIFIQGTDIALLGLSVGVGFAASLVPAVKAMRTDISKTLSQ